MHESPNYDHRKNFDMAGTNCLSLGPVEQAEALSCPEVSERLVKEETTRNFVALQIARLSVHMTEEIQWEGKSLKTPR